MNAKAILRQMREGDRPDGLTLRGFVDMYRATGEKEYRDKVLECMDEIVSPDGQILSYEPDKALFGKVSFGNALFFAWDETGEERYRNALRQIREEITRLDEIGLPIKGLIDRSFQPFIIEYDNRFGDKQSYKYAAQFFQEQRQKLFDEKNQLFRYDFDINTGRTNYHYLELNGRILVALADTIEQMDIQLYDHYRVLADLFLETVRGMMPFRLAGTELFSKEITDRDEPDIEGSLMVMYALLKGVRLGLLDEEKYLPIADNMRYCMEYLCDTLVCFAGFPGSFGIRLMVEAEIREAGLR